MRYEGTVYRPPSEAGSLVIQATIGCPHNRCAFCSMYSDKEFRKRPLQEVIEDLDTALEAFGRGVRTIFLADGNSAVLPTGDLVAIGDAARDRFPHLERITLYGSAKFLAKKNREEWQQIGAAGITRVHSGLESGDPVTLEQIRKGVEPDSAAAAFRHVMDAGIELSVYLMVGVAGLERWREHAEGSAAVLNQASPDFIRLRTFVPAVGTDWCERWKDGKLTLLDPYQALRETRHLVQNLEGPTFLLTDHISNFLDAHGRIPEDRGLKPETPAEALGWPPEKFRPPTDTLVGMML